MNLKIDTKEKFQLITLSEPHLPANMTEELETIFADILKSPVPNVVLSLEETTHIDDSAADRLAAFQRKFYESGHSFVICCLQNEVEKSLSNSGRLEEMNTTPTVSEATDIVQMEEIERELLDDL